MSRPYQVLAPAARRVIAEWLQANSRLWQGETIPSAILDAWMTAAEHNQFILEIPAMHSVTGVPVTLNLQAYAVDRPDTDG